MSHIMNKIEFFRKIYVLDTFTRNTSKHLRIRLSQLPEIWSNLQFRATGCSQ